MSVQEEEFGLEIEDGLEGEDTRSLPEPESPSEPLATTKIMSKTEHFGVDGKRLCAFGGSKCTQRPMRNYEFCVKHILQDANAPFKQCEYFSKQKGRKCTNPVSVHQDDVRYCSSHKQLLGILPRMTTQPKKKTATPKEAKKTASKSGDGNGDAAATPARGRRPSKKAKIESSTETEEERPKRGSKSGKRKSKKVEEDEEAETPADAASANFDVDNNTESDVPSSDDEQERIIAAQNAQKSRSMYTYWLKNSDYVTEEELLKMRKERIENLLQLYTHQYKRLKIDLNNKYAKYIKAKQEAINTALPQKDSNINLRMKIEEQTGTQQPQLSNLAQNKKVVTCSEVVKYDSNGVGLCSFSTCTNHRMLASNFCFQHIVYDPNQRLYIVCQYEDCQHALLLHTDPPYCSEHKNAAKKKAASAQKESPVHAQQNKKRKYVVMEEVSTNPNQSNSANTTTPSITGWETYESNNNNNNNVPIKTEATEVTSLPPSLQPIASYKVNNNTVQLYSRLYDLICKVNDERVLRAGQQPAAGKK